MDFLASFISSSAGLSLLAVVAGVVVAAIAAYSKKLAASPGVALIRDKYPVLNLALKIASDQLVETRYGFLFDAAFRLWTSEGFTSVEAEKFAKAMVKNFNLDKYLGTDWDSLSQEQIDQGKSIAIALGLKP